MADNNIFDCFIFFNELDLLELRLNELDDVVDKFVLVEGTKTFQGEEKPLYFEKNKSRFKDFDDKIIHIIVDDYPEERIESSWDREYYSRNSIERGLKQCDAQDQIIISDIDEIPRPKKILEFKGVGGIKVFAQRLFYYFFNCVESDKYYRSLGSLMMQYDDLTTPQDMRSSFPGEVYLKMEELRKILRKRRGVQVVLNGGWHFSYIGGVEQIIRKIEAFSHVEKNKDEFKDEKRLKKIMDEGKDLYGRDYNFEFVKINDAFPTYLQKNVDKFGKYIKEGRGSAVLGGDQA